MKSYKPSVTFFCFLLITFLYSHSLVHGQSLSFKEGEQASFTVWQKLYSEYEVFEEVIEARSEATLFFDLKILSCNNSSYPFDVEVTIRKAILSETQEDGSSTLSIEYDSESTAPAKTPLLAKFFNNLIDYPLTFHIEKAFHVQETSDYLIKNYESYESPSFIGLFGTTPWTFELLLTQIFHLSGENLEVAREYPVSCHQFLNWEDEAFDDRGLENNSSVYVLQDIEFGVAQAHWYGHTNLSYNQCGFDGSVHVNGDVKVNIDHPLIQERNLKVAIEQEFKEFYLPRIKIYAEQMWQSTPL